MVFDPLLNNKKMIEYLLAGCVLLIALLILIAYLESQFGVIFQLFHKADADSSRNGGELVAAVLKEHGIKYLFTLCGGHISPVLVASEKSGIRIVDVRHEVTSVFAADAVARLSGTVGVAVVTAGPGLTNTITAVKNAQMAESPVLLMGGAAANLLKGRGALQDIDQMSLFKPLCKYCGSIKRVRDIVPTVRKALAIAQSGTPGPVFVELPIDTLYSYKSVQKEIGGGGSPKKGLVNSILSWYLNNYVSNMFAGAFEEQDVTPLPVDLLLASKSQVQKAVEIVSRAKKPVLVLGSQATLPPMPADQIRASLEAMGIPCFLGGMSRGMLGRNSAIHIRQKRRDALREADVVVLAGAVPDFRLNYGRHLNRKSKIIAVNRNKEQLYKNTDAFWKPSLAVQADVGSFLVSLQKGLKEFKCDEEWVKSLKSKDEEKEETNRKKATEPVNKFLNPLEVLYHVESTLDDNSILVADGGDFVGSAAYIVRPRGPMCWLDPGAFGTLGVGGGFALGAKLVRPDAEVWIIYGDGSLGYSVAEFDTFTRHKCPVIAVVGNDACWTQIVREQEPMLGSRVGCDLAFCDYDIVAKGYGGSGLKLCGEEGEDVLKSLKAAQKECKEGKPVLVNCLIGRTNFRDGSISV